MHRPVFQDPWTLLALPALVLAQAVMAAEDPPPGQPEEPATMQQPDSEKPASADPAPGKPEGAAPPATVWKWEGAIGPMVSLSPQYSGSASRKTSVVPGFYLRYGRLSVSNASGFVARRNSDDIFRGLGLDLKRKDRLRLNISLRIDTGRRSSDSSGLTGITNVKRTIRARSSATYSMDGGWKASLGWGADLLGRGGGNVFDAGVSHDRRLSPHTTWTIGVGMSFADHRYMQSYYGITPAESVASGRPEYVAGAGMRDVSLGTGWRTEINPRWVALWGGSVGKLLGPAAKSPLTTSARQWGLNAGIAWRF